MKAQIGIKELFLTGVTFIGSMMATRKQSHIAVESIYRWMSRTGRVIAQIIIDVLTTCFFVLLSVLSGQIANRTKQMMASIDFTKSSIYWFVAAACVGTALYSAWNTSRH